MHKPQKLGFCALLSLYFILYSVKVFTSPISLPPLITGGIAAIQSLTPISHCPSDGVCPNGGYCTSDGYCAKLDGTDALIQLISSPDMVQKASYFSKLAQLVMVDPSISDIGKQFNICEDLKLLYTHTSGMNVKFSLYRGPVSDILVFKGTTSLREVLLDVKINLTACNMSDGSSCGSIHSGFHQAFEDIWPYLHEALLITGLAGRSLQIAGHSLGGAMAYMSTLAIYSPNWQPKITVLGVYTFGCPRVGDQVFVRKFESLVPASVEIMRFVTLTQNNPRSLRDPVSFLPSGIQHVRPNAPAIGIPVASPDASVLELHFIESYENGLVRYIHGGCISGSVLPRAMQSRSDTVAPFVAIIPIATPEQQLV